MTDQIAPEVLAAPPELDREALERVAAAREEARRERHTAAARAWKTIPLTFQAREIDLYGRCSKLIQVKIGQIAPTLSAFVIGPTGIGKTTCLALLLRRALAEFEASEGERCKAAIGVLWTTAAEIALSDRRHPLGSDAPPLLRRAIEAPLLVLDDVGLEPSGVLGEVLEARYQRCLPTLASSGLKRRELTDHLGSGGVRRLRDQHAGFATLVLDAWPPDDEKGQQKRQPPAR